MDIPEESQENGREATESESGPKVSFYLGDDQVINRSETDSPVIGLTPWDAMEMKPKVIAGICAMSKKSHSKPMREIIKRLEKFECISILIFDENMILNDPVESWPECDSLISFFSSGFPLEKAIAYAKLRKPLVINDLEAQYSLLDRRKVYKILSEEGIAVPRFTILDRDYTSEVYLQESDDSLEVNGMTFHKPFVEKPVSAEDHNVFIYYPSSAGGGSQRLFRKIGSRSSVYSSESKLRTKGSYIYEEFMPTDGTDVKVYTVGPDYAHAEARKSPALDGKVERDSEGKEVRYPVILSNHEKLIARKVCMAFKQTVCGFDLLRANGKSYVCDVNGFSFVKNSKKYYDDCAKILGNMIMRELAPKYNIPWQMFTLEEELPYVPTQEGTMMELRCVIAVIRHGDRTPKQKMKMEVKHPKFFKLFDKYGGFEKGKLKLKRPKQLQEVLDVARYLLEELKRQVHRNQAQIQERESKLEQLKAVLEMYGHFSGINRKVQLKYQANGKPRHSSSEDDLSSTAHIGHLSADGKGDPSLLLILKWGGELTPAGRVQAEELGRAFRCIYPGGQGDYAGFPGCGLLRLHSTYRHDLKIYASDEGRVQMTAAAFTKGMLALEGELTPILVQMVKSAHTNGLLDHEKEESASIQGKVKSKLYEMFAKNRDLTGKDKQELNMTNSTSLATSIDFIRNPVYRCEKVYSLIQALNKQIRAVLEDPEASSEIVLYHNESLDLMLRRWAKLEKDFKLKSGIFDITKIPDIYDCIKYDMMHNYSIKSLGFDKMDDLYINAQALADIIVPQEYGISPEEKLDIGAGICTPLLRKIHSDLNKINNEDETTFRLNPNYSDGVLSPGRQVRTRLYFTSESHIHSLLSCLKYGGLCDYKDDPQWRRALDYIDAVKELNYMTQIVLMLYEDPSKDATSDDRYRVELHFSPGAKGCENADSDDLPCCTGYRSASRTGDASPAEPTSDDEIYFKVPATSDSMPSVICHRSDTTPQVSLGSLNNGTQRPNGKLETDGEKMDLHPGATVTDDHLAMPLSRGSTGNLGLLQEEDESGEQQIYTEEEAPARLEAPTRYGCHLPMEGPLITWEFLGPMTQVYLYLGNRLLHLFPNFNVRHGIYNACDLLPTCTTNAFLEYLRRSPHKGIPGLDSQIQVASIQSLETLHNCLSLTQFEDFLERLTKDGSKTPEIRTPRSSFQLNRFTPRRVLPTQLSFSNRDFDFSSAGTSKSSSCVSSGLPSPTEHKNTDISQLIDFDGGLLMSRLHEKRSRDPPSSSQPPEIIKEGEIPVKTSPDGNTSEDDTTLCEDVSKRNSSDSTLIDSNQCSNESFTMDTTASCEKLTPDAMDCGKSTDNSTSNDKSIEISTSPTPDTQYEKSTQDSTSYEKSTQDKTPYEKSNMDTS
ncbi:inositol hexakisphosphate and diphosphoinositol-pentakisphosphate kinase 2-like [Amphiura filiformis]|uniref:inositol hexakisphosphate and diphosphoinositol-pentakisphosphate kinase 2-like n=1 Tax=Amphiura filiformis TaxID=82378 RepID=UPI003B21E279